jgi:preprotein translocase subunit YajC
MMLFIATAAAQTTTPASQQSPFMSLIPFALIFLVMYFLMIRPQKKRMEQEMEFLKKLTNGDEIYTKSGILGKIAGLTEQFVTLEVADGVKMKVLKSHIGGSTKALLAETKNEKK